MSRNKRHKRATYWRYQVQLWGFWLGAVLYAVGDGLHVLKR